MNRFTPFSSRIRYKFGLGFDRDYRNTASRSWQLSPSISEVLPGALFDPEDIQRVTGISPDGISLPFQLAKISPRQGFHGPTVAYEFRDAMLIGGHLLTKNSIRYISQAKLPLTCPADLPEFEDGVLANTGYGLRYFGHWMGDDLPLLLAATDLGTPVSILTNPSEAQDDYLKLLKLAASQVTDGQFKRFVSIDDAGQNAYKRERYAKLKAMARSHRSEPGAEGVMLLRGHSGVRRLLLNESEVADVARSRGFDVIDPLTKTAAQLLRICSGAKIVMGVEGSQLTNGMMWMAPTGTLVSLQPPQRFDMILKDFCDCMGLRYAFIVGEPRDSVDFEIDISGLERLLDRATRQEPAQA